MREAISKDESTGGRNGSQEEPGCGWRRGWWLGVQLATVKEARGRRGKGVRGCQTKELKLSSVVIGGSTKKCSSKMRYHHYVVWKCNPESM